LSELISKAAMRFSFVVFCTLLCLENTSCERGSWLEQVLPPEKGCNINWSVNTAETRVWWEGIFVELMEGLGRTYSPSSIYTQTYYSYDFTLRGIKSNLSLDFDVKGTCFLNWFMGTDFKELETIVLHRLFSKDRNDDWFLFIDVR